MFLKVTAAYGSPVHGGSGRWSLPKMLPDGSQEPGEWREAEGEIRACRNGLHACRPRYIAQWIGEAVHEIEFDGEPLDAGDKVVGRRARLVRTLPWDARAARLFAADCAEDVLHLVPVRRLAVCADAVRVARLYADGLATDEELAAASAAAPAAAWAAARAAELAAELAAAPAAARAAAPAAASAAARAAAWAALAAAWAALAAARDAASAAAWDAAWDAAWAAAWDAARDVRSLRVCAALGISMEDES